MVRSGIIEIVKCKTEVNPADACTKFLDRTRMEKLMQIWGLRFAEGRSAKALNVTAESRMIAGAVLCNMIGLSTGDSMTHENCVSALIMNKRQDMWTVMTMQRETTE